MLIVGPAYPHAGNQFGGPPQSGGIAFPGQQLLNDPMANMAVHYGQALADQGTDYVHKNVRTLSDLYCFKHLPVYLLDSSACIFLLVLRVMTLQYFSRNTALFMWSYR